MVLTSLVVCRLRCYLFGFELTNTTLTMIVFLLCVQVLIGRLSGGASMFSLQVIPRLLLGWGASKNGRLIRRLHVYLLYIKWTNAQTYGTAAQAFAP